MMNVTARNKLASPRRGVFANLFRAQKQTYAVPEGERVYAVGDIHGRADLLDQLLGAIERDAAASNAKVTIVFLGDYIDRGPDSRGVVDLLLTLKVNRPDTVLLLGNHDKALMDFLRDPSVYGSWKGFGAAETLLSYGISPPLFDEPESLAPLRDSLAAELPSEHLSFFRGLKPYHVIGDYMFVHAGVRPGVPLDAQELSDLLWIREDFLASSFPHEKRIVHGHTPSDAPTVKPNRLGVDTGAYATGRLSAAVLEGIDCRFLSTC